MKMPERIETEQLILRKPHIEDANTIFAGWAQVKKSLVISHSVPINE